MIRIHSLELTGRGAPSQWEARTDDDRPVYIRYRHGELSVRVGPVAGSTDDAIDAAPIYENDFGEKMGSMLDWDEVVAATHITPMAAN